MTTSTATKLLCPECQRENESERIYCHACGTRLDRSAVRFKKEPIQDTHKRVKRMFDPQRAKIYAFLRGFGRVIFGAGLVALLLDMVLPPDVPPKTKNEVLVSGLRFDLENMATKRLPAQTQLTNEQANAFIGSVLRSKRSSLDKPLLDFQRALVAFHEHGCAVTVERVLLGYWSIYTTCFCTPELKDGHLSAKIDGARVGRLPIHPKIAQHMGPLFADITAALDHDLKLVARMGAMELHEKTLTLAAPTP